MTPGLREAVEKIADGHFYEDYDEAGQRLGVLRMAVEAMEKFVRRVEAGEVRSKRTYAEFKSILEGQP